MENTNILVPFEELIGKTATEAQAIVDSRLSESSAKAAVSEQSLAQSPSPVDASHCLNSNSEGQS
jgi:hypothetical protein